MSIRSVGSEHRSYTLLPVFRLAFELRAQVGVSKIYRASTKEVTIEYAKTQTLEDRF